MDGIETLGADDGECQNTRNDRQTLAEVRQLTPHVSVDPVSVHLQRDAERHAHTVDHEVARGKVHQKIVGHRLHVSVLDEDADDGEVADDADQESDAIKANQQPRARVPEPEKLLQELTSVHQRRVITEVPEREVSVRLQEKELVGEITDAAAAVHGRRAEVTDAIKTYIHGQYYVTSDTLADGDDNNPLVLPWIRHGEADRIN